MRSKFLVFFALLTLTLPICAQMNVDAKSFGAVGDKTVLDTLAIQAALDVCGKNGGGIVRLSAGDYLSGNLQLPSRTMLLLDSGATLWASTNKSHYTEGVHHLINAEDAQGVGIIGQGKINGQGIHDYGERWGISNKPLFRVGVVLLNRCTNVTFKDITIEYSDAWTLHFKSCENVEVDQVNIFNNYRRLNSDGIDPNMCRNVRITRCHIVAGDDCIVLKTTEKHPCENVYIADCLLESAASALKLGTESHGDFRNITFTNCIVTNSPTGLGFYLKDGALMENILFSHIKVHTGSHTNRTVTPIFMDIEQRHTNSIIGHIRNVKFEKIDILSGSSVLIQGMPESPIENLILKDIHFQVEQADSFDKRKKPVGGNRTTKGTRDTLYAQKPSYITVAHARNVQLEGVQVEINSKAFTQYPRAAFCGVDIEQLKLRKVVRQPDTTSTIPPAIQLDNCRNVEKR